MRAGTERPESLEPPRAGTVWPERGERETLKPLPPSSVPRALLLSLPRAGGWGRTGVRAGPGAAVMGLRRRQARVYLRCRSSGRSERPRAPARPQQQVAVTAAAAARELKPAAAGGGGLRAGGGSGGGRRGPRRSGRRREEGDRGAGSSAGGDRGAGGGSSSSRVARDGEIPCHPDVSVMLAQTLRDLAAAKQQRQEEEEQQQPLARL